VGLLAIDTLLDRLRSLVDHRLGLLQAEPGRRADDLDYGHLLATDLGQDDVDRRGLLVATGTVASGSAGRGGGGSSDSGRRDAELLLQRLDPLGKLEHRNALQLLDPILS